MRRHLARLLSLWLLCQITGLAAPVLLASTGSAPVEELCTCPGGDHETCPMHHGRPSGGSGFALCGVQATSVPVDAALLSLAGGAAVLPSRVHITHPQTVSTLASNDRAAFDLPLPHDTPPPRFPVC